MKTENELNKDIIKTTLAILAEFPELSKYITEMPVTIPNVANPKITASNLKDYSESLNALVTKYSKYKKKGK